MTIASERVHRIVATAFHGDPPTPQHVVDHRDTNHQNNRPENLRWLTKLENILNNSITRKRIIAICGSIEAFLKDPSLLGQSSLDPNFKWMRAVTPEEAQVCLKRLEAWAKSDKPPSGGSLGEWVYKPIEGQNRAENEKASSGGSPGDWRDMSVEGHSWVKSDDAPPVTTLGERGYRVVENQNKTLQTMPDASDLVMAQTPGAAQRNWKTPTQFLCCPHDAGEEPIKTYAKKVKEGSIFSCNNFGEAIVLEIAVTEDGQSLLVTTEKGGAVKPWAVAKITYEDGLYIHTSLGSFFDPQGAEKTLCLAQGQEWTGGDTIDDYC